MKRAVRVPSFILTKEISYRVSIKSGSRAKRDRWFEQQLRAKLWIKQQGLCFWCARLCYQFYTPERRTRAFTLDHIVSLSKGGKNEEKNCVGACHRCNMWKEGFKLRYWIYNCRKIKIRNRRNLYLKQRKEVSNGRVG